MNEREVALIDALSAQDHADIARTILLVANAFDQKRHDELLPRLFDDNAQILYYLDGRVIDFSMPGGTALFKHYHDHCYWTQHLVSPTVIEVAGDVVRTASPVHAVHVQLREDGSRNDWLIGASYNDELVRRPDGWRIRKRIVPCPYVVGTFLDSGVQTFPTLARFEPERS